MNQDRIVVDANIAFKSLCTGRGKIRRRLSPDSHLRFYCPRFLFVELFKHKERLTRASGLSEADLVAGLHALVSQLEFVNEADIPVGTWMEAYRLCKGTDVNDTAYVALTLHLGGQLWTEDLELKTGLRARGFDRFFEP
jgi:predicted nucleic acid-binding protein